MRRAKTQIKNTKNSRDFGARHSVNKGKTFSKQKRENRNSLVDRASIERLTCWIFTMEKLGKNKGKARHKMREFPVQGG